jgi:hypothetical protein
MSVFSRLIKLYSQNIYSIKTPLEDFTTEILTGVLESGSLIDRFVNQVLKIEGENYGIITQKYYTNPQNPEEEDSKIDMVFFNEKNICFLENKVESGEGWNQLEKYSNILDSIKQDGENTFLRYCTKYLDPKEEKRHDFKQFRWADVSIFLSEFKENQLINDFLIFLRRYNMDNKTPFSPADLFTMTQLRETISKMDEIFEKIIPQFKKLFGESNTSRKQSIKIEETSCRYYFCKSKVFSKGNSDMGISFVFDQIPMLNIWIWYNKEAKVKDFDILVRKYWHDRLESGEIELRADNIISENPVSDYLSLQEKEFNEIEKWFIEKMKVFKDFIDKTPELDWHLD